MKKKIGWLPIKPATTVRGIFILATHANTLLLYSLENLQVFTSCSIGPMYDYFLPMGPSMFNPK